MKMTMHLFTTTIISVFFVTSVFGFYETASWNIAARPRQVNELANNPGFALCHASVIYVVDDNDATIAGVLRDFIQERFGLNLQIVDSEPDYNVIRLKRYIVNNPLQEQYKLDISAGGIIVSGHDRAGVRNGVALLLGIMSDPRLCMDSRRLVVPNVQIVDWPAMTGFRGMHMQMYSLPVELDSIKRFIDGAMLLRMNTLIFDIGHNWQSLTSGANGPYTRANIRELVQYAKVRGFTVIPSMNLLAHGERGPLWSTVRANGIDMANAQNYTLIEQMLDEIIVDFDNPTYFHAGMDEAVENIQANAAALGKTEKNTFLDHIVQVNNICKARGMQMMIWHDMLVTNSEVSEVASGTPGPDGTAAARPLVPDDVIIGVWDYNNGGGWTCIQLFKNAGNPVFGCGWMDVSVPQMANAVLTNNIAGMITGTWADIFVCVDPIAQVFWNNEHYSRSLALGGHYSWYKPSETEPARSEVFDPTLFANMCRWERPTRRIPRDFTIIDLSGITTHRNLGDDGPRIINSVNSVATQKGGLSYLKGMPFKIDTGNYIELQSQFSGVFAAEDHQSSSSYKHRVTIRNGSNVRSFDADGINQPRGENQIIIYTNQNQRTNASIWGCETVVSNGKVLLTQYYNSADSRIPRNGFVISAHGSKMGLIGDVPTGGMVDVVRVYSDHNEPAFVLNNRIPKASSVTVPINIKTQNIEILHTAVYSMLPSTTDIGRYRFTYSDGTTTESYICFGRDIGAFNEVTGFYDPNASKNVWLTYSNYGRSPFQGAVEEIYAFHWHNPHPEKTVQSVRLIRTNSTLTGWVVLGITAYNDYCGEYTLASDFDEDCVVGFSDLAVFMAQWLSSK